ncbi:MAG TPA: ketol-acid reductoisomerase [Actinopolymorphaceae bacterium]
MAVTSEIFDVERLDLAGTVEPIVRGGRHQFPRLAKAFHDIRQISVLGWGPQARAQALNLRDSLAGTSITVKVGLRPGSTSRADVERAGFTERDGTSGDWLELAATGDLVLLLVSDAAQSEQFREIFERLRPGTTLGLSHGFLVGHLRTIGESFPEDVNVIGVCPKGMGDSVRRLYVQGAELHGAGINTSFAVHQDVDGHSTDRALAWAIGIGAPYTFETTLENEYRSDLVGERAMLLGAVHGMVESLYQRYRLEGDPPASAFRRSSETITGTLAPLISSRGLTAVRTALDAADRPPFDRAYDATYGPVHDLVTEIYDEVDSGNELRSVILAERRSRAAPLGEIGRSSMWVEGRAARAAERASGSGRPGARPIEPLTAGVFVAGMMAQIDVLAERGHPWSEIVNESVVEAVDSLLPYMHARDVAYMVDNCSMTARLGARKWGPRFHAALEQLVYPSLGASAVHARRFADHPVHAVLATLAPLRPPIDIAVT